MLNSKKIIFFLALISLTIIILTIGLIPKKSDPYNHYKIHPLADAEEPGGPHLYEGICIEDKLTTPEFISLNRNDYDLYDHVDINDLNDKWKKLLNDLNNIDPELKIDVIEFTTKHNGGIFEIENKSRWRRLSDESKIHFFKSFNNIIKEQVYNKKEDAEFGILFYTCAENRSNWIAATSMKEGETRDIKFDWEQRFQGKFTKWFKSIWRITSLLDKLICLSGVIIIFLITRFAFSKDIQDSNNK